MGHGVKSPATPLGRKDSLSVILEFCKHFYTSSRDKQEERGSLKRIYRSYRQWGWGRRIRGSSGIAESTSRNPTSRSPLLWIGWGSSLEIPRANERKLLELECAWLKQYAEIATRKLIRNSNRQNSNVRSLLLVDQHLLTD